MIRHRRHAGYRMPLPGHVHTCTDGQVENLTPPATQGLDVGSILSFKGIDSTVHICSADQTAEVRSPGNADIRRITNQPPLSSITKSRRFTVFGHLARMDENADASQAIFKHPQENWRRPPGRPCTTWMKNIHDDLSSLDLGIHEARDLVQNHPTVQCRLMSLHSAAHS